MPRQFEWQQTVSFGEYLGHTIITTVNCLVIDLGWCRVQLLLLLLPLHMLPFWTTLAQDRAARVFELPRLASRFMWPQNTVVECYSLLSLARSTINLSASSL